ncbi:MAG: peptide chain release factor 2 [Candidatus Nomurabacteria bacterium]|jgi:peptide chain release factor 2|nr:peptide chain release factor 2 [Candidatus Nomurabacteria bacterium]
MSKLSERLHNLRSNFDDAYQRLDIDGKTKELKKLEDEVAQPDIWHNPEYAKNKIEELSMRKKMVDAWIILRGQINDADELLSLADDGLEAEIAAQIADFEHQFGELQKVLRFFGRYDAGDVILRITAGVGGVDAMDFAEMLERMYLRFAEKNDIKARIVERVAGEEAGLKTSVIEMKAPYAFGRLKSENGVHRLVRLSPFNADNLRQTSFALVEVLPVVDKVVDEIDPKDLRIDIYRSGGHGGQSVNTTDSAVRITHLPTGMVVAIQNERSQLKNKAMALKILAAKLAGLRDEQHAENLKELRAGKSADWGSQIRNYVLHPYTLVKDTRTKHEEHDAAAVIGGKIDGFIEAYLADLVERRENGA